MDIQGLIDNLTPESLELIKMKILFLMV